MNCTFEQLEEAVTIILTCGFGNSFPVFPRSTEWPDQERL